MEAWGQTRWMRITRERTLPMSAAARDRKKYCLPMIL